MVDAAGGAAGQALHENGGEENALGGDGDWVMPFGADGGAAWDEPVG